MATLRHKPTSNKAEAVGVLGGLAVVGAFWGLILFLMAAVPIGWVMNMFDVMKIDTTNGMDIEAALHIVGIIVIPLGAVMGIFF